MKQQHCKFTIKLVRDPLIQQLQLQLQCANCGRRISAPRHYPVWKLKTRCPNPPQPEPKQSRCRGGCRRRSR